MKTVEELCAPGHEAHMRAIKQDEWLAETLAKADQRLAVDRDRLETDLMQYRETGKWPKKTAPKAPPTPKKRP